MQGILDNIIFMFLSRNIGSQKTGLVQSAKKKKKPTTTKVNEESISGKTILKSEGEAKTLPDKS